MSKKTRSIDYKRELENASKSMILIHDPTTLIRMIVRMLVRKVHVRHAGILLYDHQKDFYVMTISRGSTGYKIPAGLVRFDKDNPVIRLFSQKIPGLFTNGNQAVVAQDLNRMIWRESMMARGNGEVRDLLGQVSSQMQMFNCVACIPAYFMNKLMAILLLGAKEDGKSFDTEELNFFSALASDVAMAIRNAQLFADLGKEKERYRNLFVNLTIALTSTIEAKDRYTRGHTDRVTRYSLAVAHQMTANGSAELPSEFFESLYLSALLHDIGKIAIPETILGKQDKLTPEEYEIMKQHTVRGVEILRSITEFEESLKGVKYHHERYDGKGYPEGLKGEEIPLIAAIIAVADAFDAMVTDRPYRRGLSKEAAVNEIRECSGTQFNPIVVKAMTELFERGRV